MNRKGYVINLGEKQSIFAEEAVFLAALEYLQNKKCRVVEAYWIDLDDEEQKGISILDGSSFGYKIDYARFDDEANEQSTFVAQEELKSTGERLHNEGFKLLELVWSCPALDCFIATDKAVS